MKPQAGNYIGYSSTRVDPISPPAARNLVPIAACLFNPRIGSVGAGRPPAELPHEEFTKASYSVSTPSRFSTNAVPFPLTVAR